MKKLTLTLSAIAALIALCYAGPEQYSGKEKEVIEPQVSCDWYRAHEWNIDVWGAWAFSAQPGARDLDFDLEAVDEQFDFSQNAVFLGSPVKDRFLNRDDAWGGGMDVKYFWSRYFGAGLEGFILNARNTGGAGLATFTFRYPIGCSRFAPYAFAGAGLLAGGSHTAKFFFESEINGELDEHEFIDNRVVQDKHARFIGQLGTGMEVRLTRPLTMSKLAVGLMADFTWNFIEGKDSDDQDFGMTRLGLDFAY